MDQGSRLRIEDLRIEDLRRDPVHIVLEERLRIDYRNPTTEKRNCSSINYSAK